MKKSFYLNPFINPSITRISFMTKQKIIDSFLLGAENVKSRCALSIRDGALYSYNLKIAEHGREWGDLLTGIENSIIVYDYMASGLRGMVSATTSQHVGMVKRAVPENRLVLL